MKARVPLALVLVLSLLPIVATAAVPSSERSALLDLYSSSNGAQWSNNTGWEGPPGTECGWTGIQCDPGQTTVTGIVLVLNGLDGTIPATIGDLPNLTFLHFFGNRLRGPIPAEIGTLTRLTQSDMGSNFLTGPIPISLGNLANLETLGLFNNQLTGPIPSSLGNARSLRELNLASNRLDGQIPVELGDLERLESLQLYGNSLSGRVPAALGDLRALRQIQVWGNALSGPLPPSLGNLVNLTFLGLRYNALYASDPALASFLESREPGWQATQTVAPEGVTVTVDPAGLASVVSVSWARIAFTAGPGGYEVLGSATPGGPYAVLGRTPTKLATSLTVTIPSPYVATYLVVRTVTEPFNNRNTVISESSAEVVVAPLSLPQIPTLGPLPLVLLAIMLAATGYRLLA